MLETATSRLEQGKMLDPRKIRLFREPPWALRLTIEGERSFLKVKVIRAFPLSNRDRYIGFMDEKNEEIGMIRDPEALDEDSRRIAQEELDRRYLGSVVRRIYSLRSEFGTSYWDVDTNRGRREFVVQSAQENVIRLGARHLAFVDVDGNRFEIPDVPRLDEKSQGLLETVL